MVEVLIKERFEVSRPRGSHVQMRKFIEDEKVTFSVPIHKGKIIKPGTLKEIMRKADISIERLIKLLY